MNVAVEGWVSAEEMVEHIVSSGGGRGGGGIHSDVMVWDRCPLWYFFRFFRTGK